MPRLLWIKDSNRDIWKHCKWRLTREGDDWQLKKESSIKSFELHSRYEKRAKKWAEDIIEKEDVPAV